ncbi:hypothetical protein O181_009292 [Austropuccinia psidii MF-1]|uniref:Uncharacterized protein n=1 Tax=Austropuccinia psidii MF-1 TaxID=1389203 RepID=A0A9Q3BRI1_9BASI|nr:hypothetical protein [Austropuccinia psidii MF-1]
MSISLEAKTHINTILNAWVITPYGARQQFGMLIFMHEMTSSLPPDHLNSFACILSWMNWLPHHLLIISSSGKFLFLGQDMLPILLPHVCHNPLLCFRHPASYNAYAPAGFSRCLFTSGTASLQSPLLMLPYHHLTLSAPYHTYAPAVPNPTTPCLTSPILMLLHPLPYLCSNSSL